jgi:hypothetical protein
MRQRGEMRFSNQFQISLLLTFCLALALLAANFVPSHHREFEVGSATLNRGGRSWLPLDSDEPFAFSDKSFFTDVTTKGWPVTAYLTDSLEFRGIADELSGKPGPSFKSYVNVRGVVINIVVAVMALITCYLIPIAISSTSRNRANAKKE